MALGLLIGSRAGYTALPRILTKPFDSHLWLAFDNQSSYTSLMKRITTIFLASILVASPAIADSVNYADKTPPQIDLLELSNQKIETSKSDSKLLVSVTASDDLNSLEYVFLGIYRDGEPSPVRVNSLGDKISNNPISRQVLNNRVTEKHQVAFNIPKGFAAGTYYVYVFGKDMAGNFPSCIDTTQKYCVYTMNRVLPEAKFTISNDGTGQIIDITTLDLRATYSELKSSYDKAQTEIASLQSKISTSDKEVSTLKDSLNLIKSENLNLQNRVNTLLSEKENLQNKVSSLNNSLGSLQTEANSLKSKLSRVCKNRPKPKGC